MPLIYSALLYLPEALFLTLPMGFFAIGLISSVEAILVYSGIIIIVILTLQIDLKFPEINDGDRISIIIAPEESSSRYANRFIRTALKLGKEFYDFKYIVFGTSSLVKDANLKLTYDTSNIIFWGMPNLQQVLKVFFIYCNITQFILKNNNYIRNIVVYSSPDLAYHLFRFLHLAFRLFRFLHKRVNIKMRFIATGMPDKEVITGIPGKQTISIINNSHRLILPLSGGVFTDFYNNLRTMGYWDENKLFQCSSAFVIDYLKAAKNAAINLRKNKEILLLIGSRESEISRHLSVAKYVLKKFEGTEFRVFLLAPKKDMQEYLEGLFGNYKCASFDLDENHDYSLARLAICKSGTSLIKPVLFGIPIIPFYIPGFRTKLAVRLVNFQQKKKTNENIHIPYLLLPNLITKSDFLVSEFLKSVDLNRLDKLINSFIENPPDTEQFRASFAREFLGVKGNCQGFKSIVNEYLKESAKNLKIIEQSILNDRNIDRETCPDPQGLLDKLKKEVPGEEPLSAFATWRYCGKNESQILDTFREKKVTITDSAALTIALQP